MTTWTQTKLASYGKPTYLGEFGIDWTGGDYPRDPDGRVTETKVMRSVPELDQAAIDAVETLDGHVIRVGYGVFQERVIVNKAVMNVGVHAYF